MTLFQTAILLFLAVVAVLMFYRKGQVPRGDSSKWFDKAHPLWLPPGTVRALIVIMAMWGILFPVVKLVAWEGTLDPAVKDILLVLLGALPGFINKYMEVRTDK